MTIIRVVSWSEIDAARQCPHKHELAYKLRWQSPETGPALSKGILWHEVLEAHYRWLQEWRTDILPKMSQSMRRLVTDDAIVNHIERQGWEDWIYEHPVGSRMWSEAIQPLLYDDRGEQTEFQSLVEWMYEGHLRYWGLDEQWRIVAVEHAAEYPLYNENGNRTSFRLKTKIDLIVEQAMRGRWRTWLIDHKSGRNLPQDKELDLIDQFPLYVACLEHVGRSIFGTIHDAARTQRNKDDSLEAQPLDTRFKRSLLTYTPEQLRQIELEAYATLRRQYQYGPGEAPRHPNEDTCRWRCDFTEPCLASRKGAVDESEFLVMKGYQQNFRRH